MTLSPPRALDVSALETHAFGSRGLVWWGVTGFIAIEATMLALCLASYFYLPTQAPDWRVGTPPPPLLVPTINTLVMLASIVPMVGVERAAREMDLRRVRHGLFWCIGLGLVFGALRVLGFWQLEFRWDQNAYASVVWTTLGIHTLHLIAEVVETIVITAVFLRGPDVAPKYFVDAEDNALYWYFIVAIWLPVYAVIYLSPRFL